jgi:hypothetical protein
MDLTGTLISQKHVFESKYSNDLTSPKIRTSGFFPAIITGSREANIDYPQPWQKRMPQGMSRPSRLIWFN